MIGAGGAPHDTAQSWSILSVEQLSMSWTTAALRVRKRGYKNALLLRSSAEIAAVSTHMLPERVRRRPDRWLIAFI